MGILRNAEVIRDTGLDSSGYFVSAVYDYSVDGESHRGSRAGFRQRFYIRKNSAQAIVDRYLPDVSAAVFYDPKKPSEAVLLRKYPDSIPRIVLPAHR